MSAPKVRWWRAPWKHSPPREIEPPANSRIAIKDGSLVFTLRGEHDRLNIETGFGFVVKGDPFKVDPYLGLSAAQVVAIIQTDGSAGLWPVMREIMDKQGLR